MAQAKSNNTAKTTIRVAIVLATLTAVVSAQLAADQTTAQYSPPVFREFFDAIFAANATDQTREQILTEMVASAKQAAQTSPEAFTAWENAYESDTEVYIGRFERSYSNLSQQLNCQLRLLHAAVLLEQGTAANINSARFTLTQLLNETRNTGLGTLGWTAWKRHFYRRTCAFMTIANLLDPTQTPRDFTNDNFTAEDLPTTFSLRAAVSELYSDQLGRRDGAQATQSTIFADLFQIQNSLETIAVDVEPADHFWENPAAEQILADALAQYVSQLQILLSNTTAPNFSQLETLTQRYNTPPALAPDINRLRAIQRDAQIRQTFNLWSQDPYSDVDRGRLIALFEGMSFPPQSDLANDQATFYTVLRTDGWRARGLVLPPDRFEMRQLQDYRSQFNTSEYATSTTELYARAVADFILQFSDWQAANPIPATTPADPNASSRSYVSTADNIMADDDVPMASMQVNSISRYVEVPPLLSDAVDRLTALYQDNSQLHNVLKRACRFYRLHYELYLLQLRQPTNPQPFRDLYEQAVQLHNEVENDTTAWDNRNCLTSAFAPLVDAAQEHIQDAVANAETNYQQTITSHLERRDAAAADQAYQEYLQYRSQQNISTDIREFHLQYLSRLLEIHQLDGNYQQAFQTINSAQSDGSLYQLARQRADLLLSLLRQAIRDWPTITDPTVNLYTIAAAIRPELTDTAPLDQIVAELCLRHQAILSFSPNSPVAAVLQGQAPQPSAIQNHISYFARQHSDDATSYLRQLAQFVLINNASHQPNQWSQCYDLIREFHFDYGEAPVVPGLAPLNLPSGRSLITDIIRQGLDYRPDQPLAQLTDIRQLLAEDIEQDYLPLSDDTLRQLRRQCYLRLQNERARSICDSSDPMRSFSIFDRPDYRTSPDWADGRFINVTNPNPQTDGDAAQYWPQAWAILLQQADTVDEYRSLSRENLLDFPPEPVAQAAMLMAIRNASDPARTQELLDCIDMFQGADKPQFADHQFWAATYAYLAHNSTASNERKNAWKQLAVDYLAPQQTNITDPVLAQQLALLLYELAAEETDPANQAAAFNRCLNAIENAPTPLSNNVLITGLLALLQENFTHVTTASQLDQNLNDWYSQHRSGRPADYQTFLQHLSQNQSALPLGTRNRLLILRALHALNIPAQDDSDTELALLENTDLTPISANALDNLIGDEPQLFRQIHALLIQHVASDNPAAMNAALRKLIRYSADLQDITNQINALPIILQNPTAQIAYAIEDYPVAAAAYGRLVQDFDTASLSPDQRETFRRWIESSIHADLPQNAALPYDLDERVRDLCLTEAEHIFNLPLSSSQGAADIDATARKWAALNLLNLPYPQLQPGPTATVAQHYPTMILEALCEIDNSCRSIANQYFINVARLSSQSDTSDSEQLTLDDRFYQARFLMRPLNLVVGYTRTWQIVRWNRTVYDSTWEQDTAWPNPLWHWWLNGSPADFNQNLEQWLQNASGQYSYRDVTAEAYLLLYLKTQNPQDLLPAVNSFAFGNPEYSAALLLWHHLSQNHSP
ncbi:MAG: hypothetical protein JW936_02965 [Sedimentisphaerales bacterium]|nr:hypothetical protein [Sedimentisphaerales bacterium]